MDWLDFVAVSLELRSAVFRVIRSTVTTFIYMIFLYFFDLILILYVSKKSNIMETEIFKMFVC